MIPTKLVIRADQPGALALVEQEYPQMRLRRAIVNPQRYPSLAFHVGWVSLVLGFYLGHHWYLPGTLMVILILAIVPLVDWSVAALTRQPHARLIYPPGIYVGK